jgi:hypothetical protein
MCVLGSELPPAGGKVVGGEDLAPPAAHAPHRVQRDVVQVGEDHQQHLTMKKQVLLTVLRIRIHRIHMFLGLPDPDPLVGGMDPDPSIIMQK